MGPEDTEKSLGRRTGSTASTEGEVPAVGVGTQEAGDRLESWKEVARFLNKGVRTVMRWEEELGLPVHRVPGAKRGRIVASRAEISQWLIGRPELEPTAATGYPTPPSSGVEAPSHRPLPWKRIYLAGALGCSVLLLMLLDLMLKHPTTVNPPVSVRFLADAMQVFGSDGRILWTHRFAGVLYPGAIEGTDLSRLGELVRIADLQGDGGREVIIVAPVRSALNSSDYARIEVDCFSSAGVLLWSYVPRQTLRFGRDELSQSWNLYDIIISRRERGVAVYAAFIHSKWGNSFVVELDPKTGRDTLRFVNAGTIHRLNEFHTRQATYLLAAGFNNEFDGGFMAMIDERKPFAASPQTPGTHYECVSCPHGAPDYYFVLPRSELNRLRQVYENPVADLSIDPGRIEIAKRELDARPHEQTQTLYMLRVEPKLEIASLRFDSVYTMKHRALEEEGELDHQIEACPERTRPQAVRLWTPAEGWTQIAVPVVGR